ncbi:dihydrofolate reductase family protein [Amycolatopsis suaedae]|nr:dihydrofolate reductase family protein [Amycolatopsis suaedae]
MRKLFLSIQVTLDGYACGPGGELDWSDTGDVELERYFSEMLTTIDGMFFGRRAYQELAGFWPRAGSEPGELAVQAGPMNKLPKYVVSGDPGLALDWTPAVRVGDDLAAEVAGLKRQPGRDLAVFAGPSTTARFVELGLVDEIRLIVFPVVLGDGRPPLPPGVRLSLVDSTTFAKSGVVILRYVPA